MIKIPRSFNIFDVTTFLLQTQSVEKVFKNMVTLWKLRKFSLTFFWQKFRETNGFTKEITKELISRNIFSVRENFRNFHTVMGHYVVKREIHCHAIFFSSNQLRVKFFSKKLISRNFCEKMVAVNFRNFHTCTRHYAVWCYYFCGKVNVFPSN